MTIRATFALGVALASVTQAAQTGVEIIPGGGPAPEAYAPKFKTRDFAEGWCEGYKFAVKQSRRDRDDLSEIRLTLTTEDRQTVECK